MFSKINQFATFNSLKNLDSYLTDAKLSEEVKVIVKPKKTVVKQQEQLQQFYKQTNVLIAIQNNPKILKFLTLVRKPAQPTIFMYVEDETNLVFVINSSISFPIVIAKFQIDEQYIYAKNTELCFVVPIQIINKFINRKDKATNQYYMIIKNEDSKLVLEYKSINCDEVKKTYGLTNVDKNNMLNTIFFNKIQTIDLFKEDIGVNVDYTELINSMNILLLYETKESSQINKLAINTNLNIEQRLEITSDEVRVSVKSNSINQISCLINKFSKSKIGNELIYWDDKLTKMSLRFIPFGNIFRSSEKLINQNDYIYYALCEWKYYKESKCQSYVLVKIITDVNINASNNLQSTIYKEVFNNCQTMAELYLAY